MTIETPDTGTEPTDPNTPDTAPNTDDVATLTAEVTKWKAAARKHEDRAKANAKAASEIEQLRQQSMTEQDRAVAQAQAETRATVLRELGTKVATAEIRAAATGRLNGDQLSVLIDGLNLAAFVDDDGEVDTDKVRSFIDGIAPAVDESPYLDLGQGARGGQPPALNSSQLERDLQTALGIR
jgi:hypothetical protein